MYCISSIPRPGTQTYSSKKSTLVSGVQRQNHQRPIADRARLRIRIKCRLTESTLCIHCTSYQLRVHRHAYEYISYVLHTILIIKKCTKTIINIKYVFTYIKYKSAAAATAAVAANSGEQMCAVWVYVCNYMAHTHTQSGSMKLLVVLLMIAVVLCIVLGCVLY